MVLFCVFFLRKVVFFCKVFFLTALFLYFASGFDCFARCFVLFCSVLFCSRKKCLFCFFSCAYDFFLHEVLLQVFFAKGFVLFLARFFCFAMGFVLFSCFAIFLQRLIFCFFAKFFYIFCKVLFSQVFSLFSASFCFWQGDVLFATVIFCKVFFSFFCYRVLFFSMDFVLFFGSYFWPGALFFWNGCCVSVLQGVLRLLVFARFFSLRGAFFVFYMVLFFFNGFF